MVKERLCRAAAAAKSREGVGGARSSRIAAAGTFSAALQIYNCTFSLLCRSTIVHSLCSADLQLYILAAPHIHNCTFSLLCRSTIVHLLYTTLQRILCDTPMLEALHIYTVDPLLEQHNLTVLHVHMVCGIGLHSCIALL